MPMNSEERSPHIEIFYTSDISRGPGAPRKIKYEKLCVPLQFDIIFLTSTPNRIQ